MKFIIRDDDTCSFTRVEELEKCYGSVWGSLPVCLSVTPFRIAGCSNHVPEKYYGNTSPLALDRNTEIVSFIRENLDKKNIDVALHGYNHYTDLSEADKRNINTLDPRIIGREYLLGRNLYTKTARGKEYLETLLNYKIKTFVPPNNAISKEGIRAIAKNNLNLIGSPSMWKLEERPFHMRNVLNAFNRLLWKVMKSNPRYPFIVDCGTHKEVEYYLLYPSTNLERLKDQLDFCYSVNGIFILSLHYHEFNNKIETGETVGDAFKEMLDYANARDNIQFITYRELW